MSAGSCFEADQLGMEGQMESSSGSRAPGASRNEQPETAGRRGLARSRALFGDRQGRDDAVGSDAMPLTTSHLALQSKKVFFNASMVACQHSI